MAFFTSKRHAWTTAWRVLRAAGLVSCEGDGVFLCTSTVRIARVYRHHGEGGEQEAPRERLGAHSCRKRGGTMILSTDPVSSPSPFACQRVREQTGTSHTDTVNMHFKWAYMKLVWGNKDAVNSLLCLLLSNPAYEVLLMLSVNTRSNGICPA